MQIEFRCLHVNRIHWKGLLCELPRGGARVRGSGRGRGQGGRPGGEGKGQGRMCGLEGWVLGSG